MNKEFQSNFTRGEVRDLVGARPDLQAYFNGVSISENGLIYPEGAWYRAPGTKFIRSTKNDGMARLIPFVVNAESRYMLEVGDHYARVLDENGNLITELFTPWLVSEIGEIHHRQSVDVLFTAQRGHEPQTINRTTPTTFSVLPFSADPPPTFEADQDVSNGGTLTPGSTTGTGVTFTAGSTPFINGDIQKQIIYGASRARITAYLNPSQVTANILTGFPDTNPIPTGRWFLRGSPGLALDPDVKEPVGGSVNLVAGTLSGTTVTPVAAFRGTDNGKYVKIYDGLARIYQVIDPTHVAAEIISTLSGWTSTTTPLNPDPAAAGSWTLEDISWSDQHGWPRTLEFHQGRLHFAGTTDEPTTDWGSAVDDFHNFASKPEADAAVEIPIAARRLNPIHWLVSLAGKLFIGDAESEHTAKGAGADQPIGGDVLPFVSDSSEAGSQPVQPMVNSDCLMFSNRFGTRLYEMAYNLDEDGFVPKDLTLLARHIGQMGFTALPGAYAQEPNSIVYRALANGQLACLTRHRKEDVTAWSRLVTDGQFLDVAVLPGDRGHRVWVIAQRLINGQTRRYIEIFEDHDPEWTVNGRAWTQVMTHSAVTGVLVAGSSVITGLAHLEGKSVDVIVSVDYLGAFTVSGGQVNFGAEKAYGTDQIYEVGLHYNSTLRTLRPAVPNNSYLGHKRRWLQVSLLLKDTIGGFLNNQPLRQVQSKARPYSGVVFSNPTISDYDAYLTVTQSEPYPLTIYGIAGTVEFSEQMG